MSLAEQKIPTLCPKVKKIVLLILSDYFEARKDNKNPMNKISQQKKAEDFLALHKGNKLFVLPNGFSGDGTTTSIIFMSNLFDEGTIIVVAKKYRDATDFHLKHSELNY